MPDKEIKFREDIKLILERIVIFSKIGVGIPFNEYALQILSLKIDKTTLKELLEKLDETGGKLAIVGMVDKWNDIPIAPLLWQGGQE